MKNKLLFVLLFCFIVSGSSKVVLGQGTNFIDPANKNFSYSGRIDFSNPKTLRFSYTGASIRFRFEGKKCMVKMSNNGTGTNYYAVVVDDKILNYAVNSSASGFTIENLKEGIHEVLIFKKTESQVAEGIFSGIELEEGKKILPSKINYTRKVEFIGNSITCGYGNEGPDQHCKFSPETENGYMSYASITARKVEAECMIVAYSGRGVYRNFDGVSAGTLPLIYERIFPDKEDSPKWDTKKWQPDLVVVNLGTNDFAKGIPDSAAFISTYVDFLKKLRSYYPNTVFLCINGPMLNDFYPPERKSLGTLKKYIGIVIDERAKAGDKKLNSFFFTPQGEGDLGCDWHPNVKKHKSMAEELSEQIKTIMNW